MGSRFARCDGNQHGSRVGAQDVKCVMADDTDDEREEPMDDDPFAVFDEWASEADQRAWAALSAADPPG